MTLTRNSYTSLSPAMSGGAVLDDQSDKNDFFFNNSSVIPTSITNSTNDYTAIISPALKAATDVVAGMTFKIIPNADNTGAIRLRITSSNPYYAVVKTDGTPFVAGEWNQQTCYDVLFVAGGFRVLNSQPSALSAGLIDEQTFNAGGTWTKPLNISVLAMVEATVWAGGGGCGTGAASSQCAGGGGGGGCTIKRFKITDLTSTVTVAIGAGGTIGNAGGNSSFGSYVLAYGGGVGGSSSTGNPAGGGGGGGSISAGSAGLNGGAGGNGGGGGSSGSTFGGAGGQSYWGGGGGASGGNGPALSVNGGNGAGVATAAVSPGGGGAGGTNNATFNTGAGGKCIVRVII